MDTSFWRGARVRIPAHFGFWDDGPSGVLGYHDPWWSCAVASMGLGLGEWKPSSIMAGAAVRGIEM